MQPSPHKMTRVTGVTEVLIFTGAGRLMAFFPEVSTLGTVSIRDAAAIGTGVAARHTSGAGMLLPGIQLGGGDTGVVFLNGLTVQLSNAADAVNIVWNNLY